MEKRWFPATFPVSRVRLPSHTMTRCLKYCSLWCLTFFFDLATTFQCSWLHPQFFWGETMYNFCCMENHKHPFFAGELPHFFRLWTNYHDLTMSPLMGSKGNYIYIFLNTQSTSINNKAHQLSGFNPKCMKHDVNEHGFVSLVHNECFSIHIVLAMRSSFRKHRMHKNVLAIQNICLPCSKPILIS